MGTIYGCQNANQEECYKYTDWEKWKSGTCVWLEGFGFYCDDESDEGGDGGDDNGDDDCYDGCYYMKGGQPLPAAKDSVLFAGLLI